MRNYREWRTVLHTNRYSYLLATLLVFVTVYSILVEFGLGSGRLLDWAFLGVLVVAMIAAGERRMGALKVSLLAALVAVVHGGLVVTDRPATRWSAALLLLAFFWGVTAVLLTDVLKTRHLALGERIRGAICVYFLLGISWAVAYAQIAVARPGAFRGLTSETGDVSGELVYYSYITLTTVGYGDVTPVSQLARTLAWLEALTGQMYIAITIARLVSSKDEKP